MPPKQAADDLGFSYFNQAPARWQQRGTDFTLLALYYVMTGVVATITGLNSESSIEATQSLSLRLRFAG
jgi:hypothetical protein